jgi:hypothetical protein
MSVQACPSPSIQCHKIADDFAHCDIVVKRWKCAKCSISVPLRCAAFDKSDCSCASPLVARNRCYPCGMTLTCMAAEAHCESRLRMYPFLSSLLGWNAAHTFHIDLHMGLEIRCSRVVVCSGTLCDDFVGDLRGMHVVTSFAASIGHEHSRAAIVAIAPRVALPLSTTTQHSCSTTAPSRPSNMKLAWSSPCLPSRQRYASIWFLKTSLIGTLKYWNGAYTG